MKCGGYAGKVQKGEISFAALNLAHMGTVNTGSIGQRLLRQARRIAASTHYCAQPDKLAVLIAMSCNPFHIGCSHPLTILWPRYLRPMTGYKHYRDSTAVQCISYL